MRRASTLLTLLLLHGCAAFGVHSARDRARATLDAIHTLHDYEIARSASSSSLARLEGRFQLEPDDEDLMLLLANAWVTHAELFLVDSYERARVTGDGADPEYQRERVRTAFERARHWGLAWLRARAPDIDTDAMTDASLATALESNFTRRDDAGALLVLGHAFLGSARYSSQDDSKGRGSGASRAQLAKLGARFLEHSIRLDETALFGSAHGLLGSYYAGVGKNSTLAARHFQRAILLANGKYLLSPLRAALSMHCQRGERDAFESELDRILKAGDPAPEVRLDNAVAKRRASRWLVESSLQADCSF